MKKLLFVFFVLCLLPWPILAAEGIVVEMTGQARDGYYYARTFDNLIMEFTVSAVPNDKMNTLVIKNSGSADTDEISGFTLYRDDGDGVFEGFAKDTEVAQSKHSWDKIWYFDELAESIGANAQKYFITATLKSGGTANQSFNFTIESASDNGDGIFQIDEYGLFFDSKKVAPLQFLTSNIYTRYRVQSSDIFAPYAVFTNLDNGQVIAKADYLIKGAAKDQGGSTTENIEICIDEVCSAAENSGDHFATWQYHWQNIPYGEHQIYIRSTDSVNNFGNTTPIGVVAQNAVPQLPVITVQTESWIKTADNTAVYYLSTLGKRYAYPLQSVWQGYFGNDFSFVKTISTAEMATYPLVGNMKFKTGTLIKIPSDPKVYKVEGNLLRWVKTEAVAVRLFGADWAKQVKDLPEGFFPDYTIGEALE